MKNISTIYAYYAVKELKELCEKNNIALIDDLDLLDCCEPQETLIIVSSDSVSQHRTRLQKGYRAGMYLFTTIAKFCGLPDYGNWVDVESGLIDLSTGNYVEWAVPDTYEQDKQSWLFAHYGQICSSCGAVMNEERDFTHGCGDTVCHMCS